MNKNYFYFILLYILIILGCQTNNLFQLTGKLENCADGKVVLFSRDEENNRFLPLDTAKVVDGIFSFKARELIEPVMAHMAVIETSGAIKLLSSTFWIENSSIEIEGNVNKRLEIKIHGSKVNEDAIRYKNFWEPKREMIKGNVKQGLTEKGWEYHQGVLKFVKQNPESYYTLYGLYQYVQMIYLFDNENALKYIQEQLSLLTIDYSTFPVYKKIKALMDILEATKTGAQLPEFIGIGVKGEVFNTRSLNNRLTLIEFWSLGCKPCIAKFPKYKEIFDSYRSKGFGILGVNLDGNHPNEWKSFLKSNHLVWQNITLTPEEFNELQNRILIGFIPQNILVNERNYIVAKNINDEKLEKLLKQL